MTRRSVRKSALRDDRASVAGTFMQMLREDHARLSRVLREIDAQALKLQSVPGAVQPVLAEALHYLLAYQHSIHHRRENELFARVRAREPRLYQDMRQVVREHRVGQVQAERIAGGLSRATLLQLRGSTGRQLARQLRVYVQHAREHMRREEDVFYVGSERVLRISDWAALLADSAARDPAADPRRFAARYPRLAERMSDPHREMAGIGETSFRAGLRICGEQVVECAAALLHQGIGVAQAVARAASRTVAGHAHFRETAGPNRRHRRPRS